MYHVSASPQDGRAVAARDDLMREVGNVIPIGAEPDRGRHFDPGSPVPGKIAELRAAVLAGEVKAEYADIVVTELRRMEPDRDRNWRTVKPFTYALTAERHGCKPRTVRTAFSHVRAALDWFNWRQVEGGMVLKMEPDGRMIGKMVARSDARSSFPKEYPRKRSSNEERTNTGSSGRRESEEPATVAVRLASWLATLPAEVVAYGIGLGLTRREVLAAADRFAKWYGERPERAPADLTGAFCGRIWLERDAAKKAAAKQRIRTGDTAASNDLPDKREYDDDQVKRDVDDLVEADDDQAEDDQAEVSPLASGGEWLSDDGEDDGDDCFAPRPPPPHQRKRFPSRQEEEFLAPRPPFDDWRHPSWSKPDDAGWFPSRYRAFDELCDDDVPF